MNGEESIPAEWRERVRVVQGICIKSTAGTDLAELAEALIEAREAVD